MDLVGPSQLSDYVAYKSARRNRLCLRFLDINNTNAPQHAMFQEDVVKGLPVKYKKKSKQQTISPTKRKAKATGKCTGGRPTRQPQNRGMTLETDASTEKEKTTTVDVESSQDDNSSTTSSEDVAPSPERQNQKTTPPATEPSRRSTRNRQSALSNAFGNASPINTIFDPSNTNKESRRFEIDSPPEQDSSNYPSLKIFIKEMGFSDETPEYQACLKFI